MSITKTRRWLPRATRQLQTITNLPAALRLLSRLCDEGVQKPYVNPMRDGGVQFEWEGCHRYFKIEISASGVASYVWYDGNTGEKESGAIIDDQSLTAIVEYVRRVGDISE